MQKTKKLNASARYQQLGVSATKEDVHAAIAKLDKGLFPNAFCKVYPDTLTGDSDYCLISHADGAGTKSILAYLYWKETGDLSVWKNIAQDAIVMNLDDLICAGATGPFLYTSTIGRNKALFPAEPLAALIQGHQTVMDELGAAGIEINFMGGETADLGDVVKTVLVDGTMTCRMRRDEVIANDRIAVGDVIIGFSSEGQTTYETSYNSGIGSNGLTAARHDTLNSYYADSFPEAYDLNLSKEVVFRGKHRLSDVDEVTGKTIGELLLSPTRSYAPLVKQLLETHRKDIHSVIHCSGGGQTKILHFAKDVHIIKHNLLPTAPVFELIQASSGTDWREMYQVYNMGQRMEVYTTPEIADSIIAIAAQFNIKAQVTGRVEAMKKEKAHLTIQSDKGTFDY